MRRQRQGAGPVAPRAVEDTRRVPPRAARLGRPLMFVAAAFSASFRSETGGCPAPRGPRRILVRREPGARDSLRRDARRRLAGSTLVPRHQPEVAVTWRLTRPEVRANWHRRERSSAGAECAVDPKHRPPPLRTRLRGTSFSACVPDSPAIQSSLRGHHRATPGCGSVTRRTRRSPNSSRGTATSAIWNTRSLLTVTATGNVGKTSGSRRQLSR